MQQFDYKTTTINIHCEKIRQYVRVQASTQDAGMSSNSARDLGESLSDGSIQMHSRGSRMLLTPLSTVF